MNYPAVDKTANYFGIAIVIIIVVVMAANFVIIVNLTEEAFIANSKGTVAFPTIQDVTVVYQDCHRPSSNS